MIRNSALYETFAVAKRVGEGEELVARFYNEQIYLLFSQCGVRFRDDNSTRGNEFWKMFALFVSLSTYNGRM